MSSVAHRVQQLCTRSPSQVRLLQEDFDLHSQLLTTNYFEVKKMALCIEMLLS